jgi:hypothetical protein
MPVSAFSQTLEAKGSMLDFLSSEPGSALEEKAIETSASFQLLLMERILQVPRWLE